jgi:hypothetical protein
MSTRIGVSYQSCAMDEEENFDLRLRDAIDKAVRTYEDLVYTRLIPLRHHPSGKRKRGDAVDCLVNALSEQIGSSW